MGAAMLDRRRAITAGAAALVGLAARGVARAQPSGIVALSEQRSRFLIDVTLNGRRGYSFVLDTGATTHFVSTRVVEALGLPTVERRMVRGGAGRNAEAVVAISSLVAGGIGMGRVRAVAWPPDRLEQHDGLIGYPFLFPRAVLSLSTGRVSLGAPRPDLALSPVKARVMRDQTLLLGGIDGFEARFVFDTGSQRCRISAAYRRRIEASEAYVSAPKLMYRGPDGSLGVGAVRPARLAFGGFEIRRPVVDLSLGDDDAFFHGAEGLMGVNLLRPYTWAIDQMGATLQVGGDAAPDPLADARSGLRLARSGDATLISAVAEVGPAHDAGLRPGQRVLNLTDDAGRQVLDLIDRGARRTVVLTPRVLL